MAADSGVKTELLADGGVLRILIDAGKGNILTRAVMEGIRAALDQHANDPALRMVFLRGANGHFSFGASVPEHKKDEAPGMLRSFHALARAVYAYPVPVVSLVEGKCLGGALELVACGHLVFCTANAAFACPEIKLGVFPPVLAALGAQRLGAPLAERMVMTGAEIDAKQALAAGFVTDLVDGDPEEALMKWYKGNLHGLSAFSLRQATLAVRTDSGAVDAFTDALAAAEKRYLGPLLHSQDGNEGIEAFLAKRAPAWRHA
ncbi:MAG: enoyl-CoA hydratase/isomerase family protein [Deltaproteobacteria bacterium]|nr:enoyl-CoA hydratase/isomerase family protein [Deltaproteobacteria bacterium]